MTASDVAFLRRHATAYAQDEGEYADWLLSQPDVIDQPDIPDWLDHAKEYERYREEKKS